MIKYICDLCKSEISLQDKFSCEIRVQSIESRMSLQGMTAGPTPQFTEKRFNLCKKCYGEKLRELK